MKEIWVPLKGAEDGYKISNLGRVASLSKDKSREYGKIIKYLKPQLYNNGYYYISISKGGRREGLHRLVASHFIPNPENKPWVLHKDGNRLNNKISNLYWGTPSENNFDAVRHGTFSGFQNAGENNGMAKLSDKDVYLIREKRANGLTYQKIADMFNVSYTCIWLTVNKKRHKKTPCCEKLYPEFQDEIPPTLRSGEVLPNEPQTPEHK